MAGVCSNTTTLTTTFNSYLKETLAGSVIVTDRYYGIFVPWCSEVANRLELPPWDLYRNAWKVCTRDALRASSSAYHLWYLTLKPIAILLWILLGHLWKFVLEHGGRSLQTGAIHLKPIAILLWILLGHLWKFVLEHGGRSLQTGAIHLKLACIHFYRFQISLNGTQILGEAGLIAMCIGMHYLRKWLQKQTYWAKLLRWTKTKKHNLVRSYTDTVHKIAKVSKILAMALPHLLFLALGVGIKILVPGLIRWVTYETPTIAILTLYYPFVSTLIWVHTQRHERDSQSTDNNINSERDVNDNNNDNNNDNENNDDNLNDNHNDNDNENDNDNGAESKISSRKKQFETTKGGEKVKSPLSGFVNETLALATTKYWLNYWELYAIIQAFGSCLSMVPIVGRLFVSHPIVGFLMGECKLFFFLWVFGMEKILGKTTSRDAFLSECLPLRMIHKFVKPLVLQLHSLVSDAISKEIWQKWLVSKTETALDIAVMVRVLSKQKRDWLVHVAEEARVLILPSITLLMPGFVTQFGVAYVQYMVPSAKSAMASSKSMKLVYLQYWLLHCGTAGLLSKLTGVLWWVPFSTHMVFLLWSYLFLPQAIKYWYEILESELLAFGILPKRKNNNNNDKDAASGKVNYAYTSIRDTKTVHLFQALVRRLPSAVEEGNANESCNNENKDDNLSSELPSATTEFGIQQQAATQTKVVKLQREASNDKTPMDNE